MIRWYDGIGEVSSSSPSVADADYRIHVLRTKPSATMDVYWCLSVSVSGCLNGGGQVKPSESQDSKELLQRVTSSYGEALTQNPCDSALARRLYSQWLEDGSEAKVGQCLYTDYHEIEQETNALTIKWWSPVILVTVFLFSIKSTSSTASPHDYNGRRAHHHRGYAASSSGDADGCRGRCIRGLAGRSSQL